MIRHTATGHIVTEICSSRIKKNNPSHHLSYPKDNAIRNMWQPILANFDIFYEVHKEY